MQLVKPSIEGLRLISVPGVAELAQEAYGCYVPTALSIS